MANNPTPTNTNAMYGVETHGRVILVDPTAAAGNEHQFNQMVPMEEMTAYAELYCVRRKDTTLTVGEDGKYTIDQLGQSLKVNLLNPDRATNQNTTLYTDDLIGQDNRVNNEGFGIESIDISMGANFNPQVSIVFRDVRGMSFFAPGDGSPLGVIFDYPPPLYKLRVKGAFGRFVEYDLHMTDHNGGATDPSSGDYTIRCEFIGHYFGPLTDMLLGYIKAAPFLRGESKTVYANDTTTSTVNGSATKVNSFFELVNRGELLYAAVENYTKDGAKVAETRQLTTSNEQVATIKRLFTSLGEINNPEFAAYMKEQKREAWVSKVEVKSDVQALKFSYKFKRDTVMLSKDQTPKPGTLAAEMSQTPDEQLRRMIRAFIQMNFETLKKNHGTIGAETERPVKMDYLNQGNVKIREVNNPKQDYEYEVTWFGLNKALDAIVAGNGDHEQALKTEMEGNLQKIANETLGLAPTIGNILEVMCKDFDYMMDRIRKAAEEPKSGLTGADFTVTGAGGWPNVQVSREIKGQGSGVDANGKPKRQTILIYPGENPAFRTWPEVRLVEDYCNSLTEQQKAEQRYDNFQKALDPSKYTPINPLESYGQAELLTNPYMGAASSSLPALYSELLNRYTVTRDYSYGQIFDVQETLPYQARSNWFKDNPLFDKEQRIAIVQMQARLEAHNVAYVVQGTEQLSQALLNSSNTTKSAVLANIAQGTSPFLKTRGKKYDKFPFRKGFIYKRSSAGFSGILAIVEKQGDRFQSMYSVKTPDTSDPVDADRERLLADLSKTIFGTENEARKTKVNEANILLYPDARAAQGTGSSDFVDTGTDLWIFKLKIAPNGLNRDQYDLSYLIGSSAFVDMTYGLPNHSYKRVFYTNPKAAKADFFRRLDDYNIMVNLYDGLFSGRSDVLAKFLTPGVIEMPRLYALHLGYKFTVEDVKDTEFKTILRKLGIKVPQAWKSTFVSTQDREKFKAIYASYNFADIIRDVNTMWKEMSAYIDSQGRLKDPSNVDNFFKELGRKVKDIGSVAKLLEPVYVVNTSSMTFMDSSVIAPVRDGFTSLIDGNGVVDDPTFDVFLDAFHGELRTMLNASAKEEATATQEIASKIQDNDFKAQIYYNFQDIYEKWIVGTQGYRPGELYERFKFITRSHQDISQDCIIDFSSLIDDAKNPKMSFYTALGRLLQENNFMFFPLHSYMEYEGTGERFDNWRKSWQIDNHLTTTNISRPAFVCMYMGGYSSRANTTGNSYEDDSFTFDNSPPEDFSTGDGFMYAFRARVGYQNNSVFSFPEWNMSEFKPTDVSLKMESDILDKPAQSQPIRKSQNLFNIYRQRSYNVSMSIPMGNMCIQPTQYFQLEGLPFLNGAFMVHEVTHSISASTNRLETKFKGYRMGKFINRVMTDYLLNYTGMSSEINAAVNAYDSNPANAVNISNSGGKRLTDQQIMELCRVFGYDYYMIKAFLRVETNGTGGFNNDGTLKIQFEPHHFPKKAIKNGVEGQTAEYKAFNEAAAIDLAAAQKATSWGLGQVMGFNHKAAGFTTVGAMVNAFNQSEFEQLKGMLNFIKSDKRLERAIKNLDFANVAKYYNGKYYRKYQYDTKLAAAYQYAKSRPMPSPTGNFDFAAGDRTFHLIRQTYTDNSTIGALSLGGQFICYILEDKVRPKGEVVKWKTAIESGLYPVDITRSPRLGRETPEITKVPHQQGIRIHQGNTADDSKGCLITGSVKGSDRVTGSGEAYEKLLGIMRQIKNKGDGKMFIQIQDTPHV